jgi:hypothetical protein
MKPNELKRRFRTKHSEMKTKPRRTLRRKLDAKKSFVNATDVTSCQVSYGIAQDNKPHTIDETVVLPAAIDTVQTMFGEKCS